MQHSVYVQRYDGTPPSYRAHCRDCDRYTSMYWDAAEAFRCLVDHTDDDYSGDESEIYGGDEAS